MCSIYSTIFSNFYSVKPSLTLLLVCELLGRLCTVLPYLQFCFIDSVVRNTNEAERSPTVTLPPKGRDATVYDLRNIVTSCVTMGKEGINYVHSFQSAFVMLSNFHLNQTTLFLGYTNPHWGKPEYKPCWWPDDIPYLAPKSGSKECLF